MSQGNIQVQIRELQAQGLGQREMARRLGIPRTTLQRLLRAPQVPEVIPEVNSSLPVSTPSLEPDVLTGPPELHELMAVKDDLWEMVEWWRQRRASLHAGAGPHRETMRYTFHGEVHLIDLVKQAADAERVSYSEVVNRALRQYFGGEGRR